MEFGADVVEAVKGYEYVSLDVYDTLLVRPYVRPKDVFRHIEMKENAPGFVEERIESEKRCMASSLPTTLDRIYEGMPERFRHLKEKELEYESNPVCPKRILDTYREIAKDHKIVIMSDMYLPSEFIQSLLKKNGIYGYERFYLSSEDGVSKGKGTMFEYVLNDLGIEKSQIIHVGDNIKTDFLNPKKQGFNAVLTEKPVSSYFKRHRKAKRFYDKSGSVGSSIIIGMDVIREYNDISEGFWKDVSYRFGGPLVSDYARFVSEHMRKDDVVMLAARDGYNIEKVLNIIRPDIRTHYVYVPRILNVMIGSNYAQHWDYKKKIVKALYGDMPDADRYYDEHKEEIDARRAEILKTFRNNITSKTGNPKGITAVDVTTMKYSSQKLLTDVFPDSDVMGIYYFLLFNDPHVPHDAYHVRKRVLKVADNINITEFFMTSPEPPISGIDEKGGPIFREPCKDEQDRLDIYDDVTDGETDYAKDIVKMFGDRMFTIGFDDIHRWLNILIIGSGSKVRGQLTTMKWGVDADHTIYVSMVYHPRDTWFHLKKTIIDLGWYAVSKVRGER
ncbi:MAG: HAD-IA family hydrolase [Candidatus Methanomethylophilaceae archaeon]|nr:HAD-IA family hydrolase [Candidatus Methanomethylophilaceae archaeon]